MPGMRHAQQTRRTPTWRRRALCRLSARGRDDPANPLLEPHEQDILIGDLKLLDEPIAGRWIAFNNGIYEDADGHSRSAIQVLSSADGLAWEPVCDGPVISPGGDGWKRAFVYAFDPVWVGDTLRLYYNGRDGWADGIERIGLATSEILR